MLQDTWRSAPSWCAGWESRRSTAGERSTLWQTCRQTPSLICGHPGRNEHFALRQCGPWTLWTLPSCTVQTHDTALTAPRKSDIWIKQKQIKAVRITWAYMLGVHSRTVLSLEDVATREPEGEKWTPVMASWWPTKRKALAFAARFQIIRVLSADPEAAGEDRGRMKCDIEPSLVKLFEMVSVFLRNMPKEQTTVTKVFFSIHHLEVNYQKFDWLTSLDVMCAQNVASLELHNSVLY